MRQAVAGLDRYFPQIRTRPRPTHTDDDPGPCTPKPRRRGRCYHSSRGITRAQAPGPRRCARNCLRRFALQSG